MLHYCPSQSTITERAIIMIASNIQYLSPLLTFYPWTVLASAIIIVAIIPFSSYLSTDYPSLFSVLMEMTIITTCSTRYYHKIPFKCSHWSNIKYIQRTLLWSYFCNETVYSVFFLNRYPLIVPWILLIMMTVVIPTVELFIYWWSTNNLLPHLPLIINEYPFIIQWLMLISIFYHTYCA